MDLFDLIKNNKTDEVIDVLLFEDTSVDDLIKVIRMTEDYFIILKAADNIQHVKKIPSDVLNNIYVTLYRK